MTIDARLIVQSSPLDGLPGYYSWKILGLTYDDVRNEIDNIISDHPPKNTSFTSPHVITDENDPHHQWWWAEGFTNSNKERENEDQDKRKRRASHTSA